MATIEYDQIQLRRGTAGVWTAANPLLAQGEIGLETDTNLIKIGDGTTFWNALGYSIGGVKTSAQLASILSGATGSGSLVFGNGPTLAGPFVHSNINPQGGATYTLVATDDSSIITASSSTPVTISIPTDATTNIPIGAQIIVQQVGTGQVTIVAATPGTTIVNSSAITPASPVTRKQGSTVILFKTAANTWSVDGDYAISPWFNSAIAANTNLLPRTQYFVTTSSAWTLTLPAAPVQGDEIRIFDSSGSAGTNNVTINPNGLNFQGSVQNLIMAYPNFSITLIYLGATYGWKVV